MESHIFESLIGIQNFLQYFVSSVVLFTIFCFIYGIVTPYPELELIKKGKVAPAISYGGAMIGFVLPLASAVSHSVSLIDMLIWSSVALIIQILVFVVLRFTFSGLIKDISEDKVAPAIYTAFISISIGWLNAASMTY